MAKRRRAEPRFLWTGLLILLPVVALAVVGVWGLRADRAEAMAEARRLATEEARRVTEAGESFLRGSGQIVCQLDLDGSPALLTLYSDPPEPALDPSSTVAQIAALHADESLSPEEKMRAVLKLGGKEEGMTAGGLPVSVIRRHAALKWALEAGLDAETVENRALLLSTHAVRDASAITPRMLEVAKPHYAENHSRRLQDRWESEERFRAFYRKHRAAVDQLVERVRETLVSDDATHSPYKNRVRQWLRADDGEELLCSVTHSGSALHVYAIPRSAIQARLNKMGAWPRPRPMMPAYFGGRLWIDGRLVADQGVSDSAEVLAVHRVGDSIRAEVVLADADALFARVLDRTRRTAWIIGLAVLAALVGWLAAWLAFVKQRRLAAMKDNFVSAVSHELKAPVAAIGLMAEEMERGDGKREQYATLIAGECSRLGSLVENVLDYARIESGQEVFEMEEADVGELVRVAVDLMRPAAKKSGMEIEVDAPPSRELSAEVDARALGRAVVNLIDNAIKYAPKGSLISVGAERFGKVGVRIVIADQGKGISAPERERIFGRFYRSGSELTRESEGVGIGLSLVRHIAQAHGGRAFVESGKAGNRFVIEA